MTFVRQTIRSLCLGAIAVSLGSCSITRNSSNETPPDTPPARPVKLTQEDQNNLLKKAAKWGLPQPSNKDEIVKIWVFRSGSDDFYALGFLRRDDRQHALVGFDQWDLTQNPAPVKVRDLANLSLKNISPTSPFNGVHKVNFGLLTGIQLIRRGNEQLGQALIEKSLGEDPGQLYPAIASLSVEDPILVLARSCLAARLNQISSPKPNFADIRQRIVQLIADQPELKTEAIDHVLDSLKENIAHKASPDGTIERVIDDFLMDGSTEGGPFGRSPVVTPSERKLILKGFEAIPALLRQRDSQRYSNHLMQGFNNFRSYPMSAGLVIDAYLRRFANRSLGSNWLRNQQGYRLDDDTVADWWAEASVMGEEEFVKRNAVAKDKDGKSSQSNELLLLAQEKYPHLLPKKQRSTKRRHWLWFGRG